MNRVLKRPMFKMGGAAEGITSGLDRKPLSKGTDPYDRAIKTTDRFVRDIDRYKGEQAPLMPGGLPNFLTSFGLNLLAQSPQGNIFQTAAIAAKEPFKTFQAAQLAERQDKQERIDDIFGSALASEYDLESQRIKNLKSDEKTFAKEQAAKAVETLYDNQIGAIKSKIEGLDPSDPNYDAKVNDFNTSITNIEKKKSDDVKSIYLSQKTIEEFQREAILKLLQNNDIEDIAPYFPNFNELMGGIKLPEEKADGGRIGYKLGTKPEPMMAPIVEQKKQTGEVQDLSYTELRARLPQEISNEIVMLLANSKQALLDFANIQTGEDVASFNQQYDVNLTLPQGA